MPLFEAERHERLIGAAWNEERARDAIDRIVADTHRSFEPNALWPIHPLDRSPERPPDSIKYMYHGAAGVIWALELSQRDRRDVPSSATIFRPCAS